MLCFLWMIGCEHGYLSKRLYVLLGQYLNYEEAFYRWRVPNNISLEYLYWELRDVSFSCFSVSSVPCMTHASRADVSILSLDINVSPVQMATREHMKMPMPMIKIEEYLCIRILTDLTSLIRLVMTLMNVRLTMVDVILWWHVSILWLVSYYHYYY